MIAVTAVDLLLDLLKANLAGGAAALFVLALRRRARAKFGARAAYALWFAPVLAVGAALAPHPAAQVVTLAPVTVEPFIARAQAATDAVVAAAQPATGPDTSGLLLTIWLVGALVAAGLLAWRQARFAAALGRLTPLGEGLFRAERAGVGPAVVGVLRPKVVAPADFEARYAPDERALILAHEGAHLAGRDTWANALACLVQCLCWFNPLAHLSARLMRVDQELACDATVVGRFPEQRRAYAELLLKTQLTTQPLPLGCHWPAGAEHPLKERIAMLKSPLPAATARRLGAAMALCACAGAATLAWAASPGATPEASGPGPAERAEAKARDDLHPEYTCDHAIAMRGGNCKIIRQPTWLAVPTHEDMMRQYPAAALKAGVTAEVFINCGMTEKGLLTACTPDRVEPQAPQGVTVGEDVREAFGAAAVTLSRYYQFPTANWAQTGRRGGGHGALRVVFNPDPAAVGRLPGPLGSVLVRTMPSPPTVAPAPTSEAAPAARKLLAAFAPAAPVIVKPEWLQKPVAADIVEFYPKAAVATRTEGSALMRCGVTLAGELSDCAILTESPQGQGFGDAAIAMAAKFKMKPQTRDGAPVAGGQINIPIRFMLAPEPASGSPTPPPAA